MRYINDDLKSKTILVTGGAGFIGSNLVFYFKNNHPMVNIVVLDNFEGFGDLKNLRGFSGKIINGDINDKELLNSLKIEYKFDYIFHQAAISDTTCLDEELVKRTNVDAYKDLLDIAVSHKAAMIYASSASTYGNLASPQKVGLEAPQNIYGLSKLEMDKLSLEYIKKDEISIIGLRCFNVYGGGESFKKTTASMILQFGHQLLADKNPCLFENSAEIYRDFIYIEDIIQANIKAMFAKKSGIYNVGTSISRSFLDVVDILQTQLGTKLSYEEIKNPYTKYYQFHTQADIIDTKKYLGFEPNYTLEDGIKAYLSEIKRTYKEGNIE